MYTVKQNPPEDQERRKIAKAVRSAVRLHFSMAADDYINAVLPAILDEHARAMTAGEEFVLRLSDLPALPAPTLPDAEAR